MSAPASQSESLRLLKQLMLDEETKEIQELRATMAAFEAGSPERISRHLARAIRLREGEHTPAFEELVAALQPGIEAGIARSVSQDKTRMSRALYPVMGPAMRSYVMEQFRNLVQDVNETIRNTTSIDRIWWRIQARLAGKPFPEYLLLKTASFKVEDLFLIDRASGILLQHVSARGEAGMEDADLMTAMLTAIRSFVRDSFSDPKSGDGGDLQQFSFGDDRRMVIEAGPEMILAAAVRGMPTSAVHTRMEEVLEELHHRIHAADFESGTAAREVAMPLLQSALLENRSEPPGGMWRFWVFTGIVLGGLVLGGLWVYRDWSRWQAFAAALREEPGIQVTDVRWRRSISGLRDPLAREPKELAPGFGLDPAKITLAFQPFQSLHPAFVEQREVRFRELAATLQQTRDDAARTEGELAKTRQQLDEARNALATAQKALAEEFAKTLTREVANARRETMRETIASRYAHLPQLAWKTTADGLAVSGAVPEPEFSQLRQQLAQVRSLGRIDVSGLKNSSDDRIGKLIADISAMPVIFESGAENALDAELVMAQIAKIAGELKTVAESAGVKLRYTVLSHPLIGSGREGNRIIERARAAQVRARLIASAISPTVIEVKLSEDAARAGGGVVVIPERTTD